MSRADPVRVTWTGELEGGGGTFPMVDREARDTELVLDSSFWFSAVPVILSEERKLTVTANLSVGPKLITEPELKASLPIQPYHHESVGLLRMTMGGGMMTGPTTAQALAGSTLTFSVSTGPPGAQYAMQWSWLNLGRNEAFPGRPFAPHHEGIVGGQADPLRSWPLRRGRPDRPGGHDPVEYGAVRPRACAADRGAAGAGRHARGVGHNRARAAGRRGDPGQPLPS